MNENKKKYGLWISLGALLILAAVAVTLWFPWRKKEVTLTLGIFAGSNWDVPIGNCYAVADDVIARFEADHPGVKVRYTSGILKNDYSEWLAEQVLQGKAPDVYMVLADDFNLYSSLGAMKDLEPLMRGDAEFERGEYYSAAFEFGQFQGKQYALPYESVPTLMFVNKTLLQKEGIPMPSGDWTWDQFYEICRKVTKDTDGNGVIDQFGTYDYTWKNAAYSNGAVLFNEDGTTSYFGDSKMEEAVKFVKDLNSLNDGYLVTSKAFDMGRVAFQPFSFSEYRTYKPYPWRIKKYSDFEWDCIKLPAGPQGENVSELSTLLMGINGKTKEEKLAWELLKMFCYDKETQRKLFTDAEGVSVLREVTESSEVMEMLNRDTPGSSYLNMGLLSEVMDSAVVTPKFRKYEGAMSLAGTGISEIINGQRTLDNGLLVLQREINNYIRN